MKNLRTQQLASKKQDRAETGVALLVAMFALLILSLIGLAMMLASSTELLVNDNFKKSRSVFFGAEAGTEEARYRIGPTVDAPNVIAAPTTVNGVAYIRANGTINPTDTSSSNRFADPEYATITKRDNSGSLTTVGSSGLGTPTYYAPLVGLSTPIPYAWVKITMKTELLAAQDVDQDNVISSTDEVRYGYNTTNGKRSQYRLNSLHASEYKFSNPVYLVTAMAVDSNGTQRKVQTEVTPFPPEPTKAAVDSYENVDFHGNLTVSGANECNPGVGDVAGVRSHGTVDSPNGSQHITGSPAILASQTNWGHDVPALIAALRKAYSFPSVDSSGTNITCSGTPATCDGTNVNLGTYPGTMKYYYSPGNLSIRSNDSHGYGILLVDGDVTFHGGFSFRGIIICRGTINFTGGGSDEVNIHGAVIAGDSITDTTTDLGGSINIHYNACDVANTFSQMPMVVLTFKDRALY